MAQKRLFVVYGQTHAVVFYPTASLPLHFDKLVVGNGQYVAIHIGNAEDFFYGKAVTVQLRAVTFLYAVAVASVLVVHHYCMVVGNDK